MSQRRAKKNLKSLLSNLYRGKHSCHFLFSYHNASSVKTGILFYQHLIGNVNICLTAESIFSILMKYFSYRENNVQCSSQEMYMVVLCLLFFLMEKATYKPLLQGFNKV